MIIDSHVHLISEKGYADKIVRKLDELKVDKACLLAMQNVKLWGARAATNEQVIEVWKAHPDRFIPFGFVDLGLDPPNIIDRLFMEGFRGLKFTRSRYDYNHDELMPYYERAAAYKMILLFHTGTVMRTEEDKFYDVDSSRLRPIYLDRIARKFPELSLIGAHLGNPWCDEAAMTLFWNPNVYFDLSGTLLKRKSAAWFKETLWWFPDTMNKLAKSGDTHYKKSHPFERLCFGTDVPVDEMDGCMEEYTRLFDELEIPQDIRDRVMGGNIVSMLGIS